jgi:hypothetical protein
MQYAAAAQLPISTDHLTELRPWGRFSQLPAVLTY